MYINIFPVTRHLRKKKELVFFLPYLKNLLALNILSIQSFNSLSLYLSPFAFKNECYPYWVEEKCTFWICEKIAEDRREMLCRLCAVVGYQILRTNEHSVHSYSLYEWFHFSMMNEKCGNLNISCITHRKFIKKFHLKNKSYSLKFKFLKKVHPLGPPECVEWDKKMRRN